MGMLFSATVPFLSSLTELHHASPGFGYMLFASALLAAVALVAGLARNDLLALRARSARVKVAVAVASGSVLAWAAAAIAPSVDLGTWQPDGLYRLPLYLIALAYGPSIGCIAGLCYVAVSWVLPALDSAPVVLALELTVLGWLAIHPSPARYRWAGPAHAVLAYALAWLTAGLVGVMAAQEPVSPATIAIQHAPALMSVLATAALLAALSPQRYRRWFPESRTQRAAEPS